MTQAPNSKPLLNEQIADLVLKVIKPGGVTCGGIGAFWFLFAQKSDRLCGDWSVTLLWGKTAATYPRRQSTTIRTSWKSRRQLSSPAALSSRGVEVTTTLHSSNMSDLIEIPTGGRAIAIGDNCCSVKNDR